MQSDLCQVNDPNTPNLPTSNLLLKPNTVVFTDQYISIEGERFLSVPKKFPLPIGDTIERGMGLIDPQGNATIKVFFYNAKTNEQSKLLKPVVFQCQLNNGVRAYMY